VRTEKHDVFVPVLHDRCVVNGFHGIGDLGLMVIPSQMRGSLNPRARSMQ
jgi:hypothetical protein